MTDQSSLNAGEIIEAQADKFQFRLWHVFYATTLFAVCVSLSVWMLIPAAVWIAICYWIGKIRKQVSRVKQFVDLIAVGIVLSCCFCGALAVPGMEAHEAARGRNCGNNIRQIMLGMLNYESANLHFPAAIETADDGTPMHSWRVRILPFIEQQKLYDQYDFSKPWDSPKNLKLVDQMPDVYRCPLSQETSRTTYKLIVGEGSLFDGGGATFARIRDGSSNTVAIVEDAINPVEWTRPSDITIEQAIEVLKPKLPEHFPHVTDSKFVTTFAPGNYGRFDGSIAYAYCFECQRSEVRKLLGIDDGISQEIFDLNCTCPESVNKLAPWIALVMFFLLMTFPLGWVFRRDQLSPNSADVAQV